MSVRSEIEGALPLYGVRLGTVRIEQARRTRVFDRIAPRGDPELPVDRLCLRLHRVRRDEAVAGDLRKGEVGRQVLEDVQLGRGQVTDRRSRGEADPEFGL